jgi:hypothetical protein
MKASATVGAEASVPSKRRKNHKPEQIVAKPRDAGAMQNTGNDAPAVFQTLEIRSAVSPALPARSHGNARVT